VHSRLVPRSIACFYLNRFWSSLCTAGVTKLRPARPWPLRPAALCHKWPKLQQCNRLSFVRPSAKRTLRKSDRDPLKRIALNAGHCSVWTIALHRTNTMSGLLSSHTLFFSLRHLGHFLQRHFGHWNVSVIFLTVVSKIAVTVFISLYFQSFWPKWLIFFRSFQKRFGVWSPIDRKKSTYTCLALCKKSSVMPALMMMSAHFFINYCTFLRMRVIWRLWLPVTITASKGYC